MGHLFMINCMSRMLLEQGISEEKMINNLVANVLCEKSPDLYNNYSTNCIVVKQMLEKYKKYLPNIADYTILHFMDIIEFFETIVPKKTIEEMSPEECYCVLLSALCIHTGLGINKENLVSYIKEKNIACDVSELSSADLRMKYGAAGSIYLFEKYADIFEIPSKEMENIILFFMNRMSGNLCPWIEERSHFNTKYDFLSNSLAVSNCLAELQNRNIDLSYDEFEDYNSNEIKGFVERISVSKVYKEERNLVVEVNGSDTVVHLVQLKLCDINEKIKALGTHASEAASFVFDIDGICLKHNESSSNKIFLNADIEEGWTKEDHELFNKLTEAEKAFYLDYLSAEFSITKSLKEFVSKNNAELYGIEFRVKSPKSIYEKLHDRNYPLEKLADVIRYSLILDPKTYVEDIKKIVELLEEAGWKTYCLENYWKVKKIPYNAVNSNLVNNSGIRAELQYHTKDSFRVKMSKEDHDLYKLRCSYERGSKEYNEILLKQFALYDGMEIPQDIETL